MILSLSLERANKEPASKSEKCDAEDVAGCDEFEANHEIREPDERTTSEDDAEDHDHDDDGAGDQERRRRGADLEDRGVSIGEVAGDHKTDGEDDSGRAETALSFVESVHDFARSHGTSVRSARPRPSRSAA